MWNHTPIMWQAMNDQIVARPKMTAGEAEDLFAYLYSLRYFDRAGDEERGKGRFDRIGCSGCHLVAGDGVGPAISRWTKPTDPVALARQMWNHAATMQRELAGRAVPWISISGRDIADINAYVRQVRGLKPAQVLAFSDSGAAEGRALFEGNCRRCHSGTLDISRRMANGTFLDIAAAMWNHRPRMAGIPIISSSEMQSIVAYVWQQQYLGESGSVAGGRDTFNKKCGSCHNDPVNGASRMARGERIFTPFSLLSQAWEHGTLMQQAMKNKAAGWPSLSPREVSDVVAFLNTRP
jgi:mono/diheme cytochrome c family protein